MWIIPTAFGFFLLFSEVVAEYCEGNTFCHSPSKCCETRPGCCYDSVLHSKHFRLQIWNMWYFWFVIIFMMMSCFGWCGYYRRRRLALLSGNPDSFHLGHTHSLSPSHSGGRSRRGQERQVRPFNCFSYSRSSNVGIFPMPQYHQPPMVSSLPPAYAEVVSQPGLYPVNAKSRLPPYPGPDTVQPMPGTGAASTWPQEDSSQPPPYSELINGDDPNPPLLDQQHQEQQQSSSNNNDNSSNNDSRNNSNV